MERVGDDPDYFWHEMREEIYEINIHIYGKKSNKIIYI
jgi:hypothetical protein